MSNMDLETKTKEFFVYKELIDEQKFMDNLFDPTHGSLYASFLYHGIKHDRGNGNYWTFSAIINNPNWDNFIFKLGIAFQKSLKKL